MIGDLIHFDEPFEVLDTRSGQERLITGRIIPYGQTIMVRGRPESFAPGALKNIDASTVKLLHNHDPHKVIGKAVAIEERQDGAYATFKVAKTSLGDELLQLASEGIVDSLSAGFIAGEQSSDGVHRRIKALPEVSLVTWGAYPNAKVLSVRSEENSIKEETMSDKDIAATEETVDETETSNSGFEALEQRMEEYSNEITRLAALVSAPAASTAPKTLPTAEDWFKAEIEAAVFGDTEKRDRILEVFDNLETRELADVTGTWEGSADLSEFVVQEFMASQLVNVLDARRPVFRNVGDFAAPRSGEMKVPEITQSVTVAKRAGQKQAANSQAPISTSKTYSAVWFDGAVDVALELIQTAEIGVVQFVYDELLKAYAVATEEALIDDIEAGGLTYVGALATNTYAAFAADVAEQAIAVRQATGAPATKLAVPYATWPTLVAFIDGNDRRQFTAGDHSDGNLTFTAESFALPGGITVYAAGVTDPILYNEDALKAHDYGITRVEATNVNLMGRDIGILGRTMYFPRIPAGVVVFGDDPESSSS